MCSLISWSIDWSIDQWLVDWLIDWFIYLFMLSLIDVLIMFLVDLLDRWNQQLIYDICWKKYIIYYILCVLLYVVIFYLSYVVEYGIFLWSCICSCIFFPSIKKGIVTLIGCLPYLYKNLCISWVFPSSKHFSFLFIRRYLCFSRPSSRLRPSQLSTTHVIESLKTGTNF